MIGHCWIRNRLIGCKWWCIIFILLSFFLTATTSISRSIMLSSLRYRFNFLRYPRDRIMIARFLLDYKTMWSFPIMNAFTTSGGFRAWMMCWGLSCLHIGRLGRLNNWIFLHVGRLNRLGRLNNWLTKCIIKRCYRNLRVCLCTICVITW